MSWSQSLESENHSDGSEQNEPSDRKRMITVVREKLKNKQL